MGEYATRKGTGERIKIGTCEDMYYLRADQIHKVSPEDGNVDPAGKYRDELRFRFPWPDEDDLEPGSFEDACRSRVVRGIEAPVDFEHGTVQFVSPKGYNVCLPCPEGPDGATNPYHVHRNGFSGAVRFSQQKYLGDLLVLICECGGCGRKYRVETLEDIEPILVALRSEADGQDRTAEQNGTPGNATIAREIHRIANRIANGYLVAADLA